MLCLQPVRSSLGLPNNQCTCLVWTPLLTLKRSSELHPGPTYPQSIRSSKAISNLSTKPGLPQHSSLEQEAHFAHLTSFQPRPKPLDPKHPHDLSSTPTCSVQTRLRTKKVHMPRTYHKNVNMGHQASIISLEPTDALEMFADEN